MIYNKNNNFKLNQLVFQIFSIKKMKIYTTADGIGSQIKETFPKSKDGFRNKS